MVQRIRNGRCIMSLPQFCIFVDFGLKYSKFFEKLKKSLVMEYLADLLGNRIFKLMVLVPQNPTYNDIIKIGIVKFGTRKYDCCNVALIPVATELLGPPRDW